MSIVQRAFCMKKVWPSTMTPEQQRERYKRAKERGVQEEPPEKLTCRKCGREWDDPKKNFPGNPLCRYGLAKTCNVCKREMQEAERKAHPEKHAARMRVRRAKDPEHYRELNRAWNAKNRKRRREQ